MLPPTLRSKGREMKSPDRDCDYCFRLAAFRAENRAAFPDKFNAPVPSFGEEDARLLIVGLAPGLRGANFSGRPFTGDYAGDLLYATLLEFGLASGTYEARADDGLMLQGCRITNAVRCVPPENKPTGPEIRRCGDFLETEINSLSNLRAVLALGLIAHNAVLRACGEKISACKFTHGACHKLQNGLILFDSYHCSRYNTNTGRLSRDMFRAVFADIQAFLQTEEKAA